MDKETLRYLDLRLVEEVFNPTVRTQPSKRTQARTLEKEKPPDSQPQETISDVTDEIRTFNWSDLERRISDCKLCGLHKGRTKAVPGIGNYFADWMFIGEGPGAEEDRKGEPFVGRAGKLLNQMLAAMNLERASVYITNIVKCRPPENRNPEYEEAATCMPYLKRQIELVRPKVIIALGGVAAKHLLASDASVGSMRGKVHSYAGIPVITTYHPAYLLRKNSGKQKTWSDLCLGLREMRKIRDGNTAPN